MIYYPYRWFFAALLSLLLQSIGYFYFLSQPIHETITLREKEQTLIKVMQKINANKKLKMSMSQLNTVKSPLHIKQKNEFEHIADLVKLFQLYRLTVSSIKPLSMETPSSDIIQLSIVVEGRFNDFILFLFRISEQLNPMQILDFSCQLLNTHVDYLRFAMTLLIVKKITKTTTKKPANHSEKDSFLDGQLFCPPQGFHM